MYLFVNDDLKMGKGKIASQVGHCVQHLLEHVFQNKQSDVYKQYILWKSYGSKKIVLKATQSDLELLQKNANTFSVYDAGHTQIEPNSLTVVGFAPTHNTHLFKNFKLL